MPNAEAGPTTTYVAYAAFAHPSGPGSAAADTAGAEAALEGVAVRGVYDLTGFRAEADLLLWLISPSPERLQEAIGRFRRSPAGSTPALWWSAIGVHRQAEFNPDHRPAFLDGAPPLPWLCVYPYVRTHEWYLLAPEERRRLLGEHGRMGRSYPDVLANTVSSFGLGDYEWLLAFEANEPARITDLMRHLRAAEARRFTRHELPFLFGRRARLADVLG